MTVDLLTTGIDVPAITNLVFLRRVNSRTLYDQMIGRATRLCPEIGKEVFQIYDAVDLYPNLQSMTEMKPVVVNPAVSFETLFQGLETVDEESHRQEILDHHRQARPLDRPHERRDPGSVHRPGRRDARGDAAAVPRSASRRRRLPASATRSERRSARRSTSSPRRRSSPLTLEGPERLAETVRKALSILRPPPELTISDWADANRRLSSEASAEPGQWRTSRAE